MTRATLRSTPRPRKPRYYTLVYGIVGRWDKCSHGPGVTTDKAYALYFAREENKYCPEHRGRNVGVAPCDEFGNVAWGGVERR